MNFTVVPFFRPAPRPRDWNNQELAEFYRVEASMIRGGMSVVTDRGLSDEGDPWFVFCRADNEEIIVHFARIDGEYVVASPAFDECVRGNDFRPLIESLIERHPIVIARPKDGARLSIHPAALLVALVTTCFFKLGQTDAVAAEAKVAKVAPPSAAAPAPADARDGGGATILNGREATAVLTAIAAAVTWAQPALAETSFDAPWLGAASGAALGGDAHIGLSEIETVDLESASSAPHHTLALSTASADAWTEAGAQNPFQASLHVASAHSSNLRLMSLVKLDADGPVNAETMALSHNSSAATASTLNPHSSVVTTPAPLAGEPVAPASDVSSANASSTPASSANQEIASLLGASAQSHLVTTLSADEQQLVTSAPSPATSVVVTSEAAPPTSSPPPPAAPESAHAPADATEAPKPTAPATATLTDVNQAILHFTALHPDFQITRLSSEIIIFDSHLTVSNAASATQEFFTFQDGSSIFLIGLPAAPAHGEASWL
ncbi:hypothetical protein [Rhodoblastus acidophilus]|uniref:hypothetical protein n=1 Tax=Rhodoblastus acidophilus TaxID=1074 RepID=UPI002225558C|nr:hypothetical protein [Rhodoblastus acidophilus]